MAMKKSWANDLYKYSKTFVTKSDFQKHMNEVVQYVAPNPIWRMPSYTSWGNSVQSFANSRGVKLIPYFSNASPTLENASTYVKDGLRSDAPVGLLMYYNPKLAEYDWHWMTITKYFRDTADNRYIAVSSWGTRYSLNWKWVWENSLYGAILYFSNSAQTSDIVPGTTIHYGDVNCDNVIDSADYTLLRKYIMSQIISFPVPEGVDPAWGMKAADVNDDGVVDSADYTILNKYLIGSTNHLPY
jgi:hypothetical protein